jgi:hypothetical protein
MKACIIRKVIYKAAGKRPRWGFILAEREGLALLLVACAKHSQSHSLHIAAENVAERLFEPVNVPCFPLEAQDMEGVGTKLTALASGLAEDEIEQWLKDEVVAYEHEANANRHELRSRSNGLLAWYDKNTNRTFDRTGKNAGAGDQTGKFIPDS